jgi:putative endonuclease
LKNQNKVTGNRGEDLAAEYLQNKNFLIIERNFRTRFGEIDIICYDGPTLVFVEVKTKIGHDFGEPEEMATKSKIAKVKRMGEVYMQDKGLNVGCRVDVVAIVLENSGSVEKLEHYQAVY